MKVLILHPLGYEDKPRGHEPDHFRDIERELTDRGHEVVPKVGSGVDVAIFNSGVWNIESGTSPYGSDLKRIVEDHTPVVWMDDFDHAGTPESWGRWPGSDDWRDMQTYDFNYHDFAWFGWSISRVGANRILFFMRKMQKSQTYPDYVLPLEYPIFEDFPLASKEDFCSRPVDVCGLANISGPRAISMIGLYHKNLLNRLELDLEIIPHYRRLDYKTEYLPRHRAAKFFLEADASLGSERPLRLITVAAMLRVKSDHRLPFPFTDMVNMVEIGDYDGHISSEDVEKVLSVVRNPDLLYSIYVSGASHMREHYSLAARSKYVVDKIEEFMES